jgi:hypothetical protein
MSDDRPSSKQLTMRQAFMSFLLIAVGIAVLTRLVREIDAPDSVVLPVVLFPAWFGGGALIGAGLSHLKSRWWIGAVLSIPVQFALLFVLGSVFPNL